MNNSRKNIHKQIIELESFNRCDKPHDFKRKSLTLKVIREYIRKKSLSARNLYIALFRALLQNEEQNNIIICKNKEIQHLRLNLEQLRNEISYLHENPPIAPIHIWGMLKGILDYDKSFHFPQPVKLHVQNSKDEFRYINKEFNPKDIVCITSIDQKEYETIKENLNNEYHKRMKRIWYKEESLKYGWSFKYYILNNNKNFQKLCDEIDVLNNFLCVVGKNAIVNVRFYELCNDTVVINEAYPLQEECKKIKISKEIQVKGFSAFDAFKKIKEHYDNRVLFQKRALGYKQDMGF